MNCQAELDEVSHQQNTHLGLHLKHVCTYSSLGTVEVSVDIDPVDTVTAP